MKKVAKAILIALGIILVIGSVAVLCVNLYVQSAGTRARIENGLSQGLKTQVKIGSVSFMPWYGLKISGIRRAGAATPADFDSLEIADIKLRFRLWNLLRHDVVIRQITVDGVNVLWSQNPEGKWQMPSASPTPAESPVQTETPTEPQTAEQQPPAAPAPPAQPQPPAQTPPPRVTVDRARLRDASFSFYDRNHDPVAAFTGVNIETPSPTDQLVEGYAVISQAVIQQKFHLENWKGHFKYTPDGLSLYDTSCEVAGGTATGALDVKVAEQDSPFVFNTKFSGVSLDRLLTNAGVTRLQASGDLSGFVNMQGNSRDSSQAQGTGQIVLNDGFITKGDLFETLNMLLHTDKFRGFHLEDAHSDFHVGGGQVFLDDLVLKCAALTFTSQGAMTTRGNDLLLKCRFEISSDVARQIPDFLMEDFGRDATTGARYLDFPITGSINNPDYSALTKTLPKKIEKSLGNFLKKWMNSGRKTESPPAVIPAQTPATPPQTPTAPAAPKP